MNGRKFFAELKRRNVYKVAVAYAIPLRTREGNPAVPERHGNAPESRSLTSPAFPSSGWSVSTAAGSLRLDSGAFTASAPRYGLGALTGVCPVCATWR